MANNKEMKTLGGYEIVDEKAREDIITVSEKADEALSLAKGATKAFVYDTYSDMIAELNALDKAELLVNFHVMIRTVCVPDLWISGVSDEHVEYTYTSNEDFITDLTEDGVVQVGYFVLSALETQKVKLDDYVKKDDYATNSIFGLVVGNPTFGVNVENGKMYVQRAIEEEIDKKESAYKTITPSKLDYAVKKALSDCKLSGDDVWTEDEKVSVRALLDLIGVGDFATQGDIKTKTNNTRFLTSKNIDLIVKQGLANCQLTGGNAWTDEEKAKALELLGADGRYIINPKPNANSVLALKENEIKTVGYTNQSPFAYQLCILAPETMGDTIEGNGYQLTNTPTRAYHAANKKYVDDNFIPKNLGEYKIPYTDEKGDLQTNFGWSSNNSPYTFALRRENGELWVNTPTNENSATTKKYVDDLVGSVESILTELHTYAQTKIGGEA